MGNKSSKSNYICKDKDYFPETKEGTIPSEKDINSSNIVNLVHELFKYVNDTDKYLVYGYYRQFALNKYNIHIPTAIINYCILFGFMALPKVSIERRSQNESPPIPDGLKATCLANPNELQMNYSYPVITFGNFTYWPYSYINNCMALNIVKYNSKNEIIKQWEAKGTRYIFEILNDPKETKITFVGQGNTKITWTYDELELIQSN